MARDSLYAIGIGGTGAKCLEAVIQLAAVGLFASEPIRVLFVDADETNGNLERARVSLSIYQRCYQLLLGDKQQCAWMKTQIESYKPDLWSPFGNTSTNKTLGSFFNYNSLNQNNEALGNLFNVLYSKKEREVSLDVGFRGRPAIGAAIMSRLDLNDLEEDPWATLIQQVQSDAGAGKSPKIFLCGSIFGGTGASGLPTIARLIANKLEKENLRDRVKIASLFVLPYFQFPPPTGAEAIDEVYASSDKFLLNTEAALRYYVNQSKQFDAVYLLGNQNLSNYKFSIGKKSQRNEPHFIELYAALAARHFLLETPSAQGTVVLNSRQDGGRVVWLDLPEMAAVRAELVNATRFAYVWLANIEPEMTEAKQKGIGWFQKNAPWFPEFFRPEQGGLLKIFDKKGEDLPDFNDPQEQEAIKVVTNWCKDYLRWLSELHQCDGDNIDLFRYRAFANLDGQLRGEYLPDLDAGDNRDKGSKSQDTVQQLKEHLNPKTITPPNKGTAGLAKAVYILCRL
ncbi:MAG: hypothetical protein AB4426_31345 [Xenococcaceae cyanobacterium]